MSYADTFTRNSCTDRFELFFLVPPSREVVIFNELSARIDHLLKNERSIAFNFNSKDYNPKIIAISKTFKKSHILPLVKHGHLHFGENKVQEAINKSIFSCFKSNA